MQMSPTLSPSSIPSHPLPRLAPIPFAAAAISLIIIHCVVNALEKEESLSLADRKNKMDGMNETRSVTPKSLLAYPRRRAGWLHGGLVAPLLAHIATSPPLSCSDGVFDEAGRWEGFLALELCQES